MLVKRSSLPDVVVSDLRYKSRDKTAYEQWKKNEISRVAVVREIKTTTRRTPEKCLAAPGAVSC